MVEKHRRPAGEGSVYQRPDGRWEAVLSLGYGPGGKRLRRKVSAGTRAGAAEALRALCRERDQGLVVAKRLTVEKWLDEWLRDHARVTTRPNTYRTYEQIVRQHLVPAFGRYQLDRLAPSDVAAYLHEKAQKLSAKTCQHHHAVLRRALRKAEEYGYVNRNVARVVSPPTANRRTGTWLDVEQARTFLASIVDHPLESLFVVAAATGVRRWPGWCRGRAPTARRAPRCAAHGAARRCANRSRSLRARRPAGRPPRVRRRAPTAART